MGWLGDVRLASAAGTAALLTAVGTTGSAAAAPAAEVTPAALHVVALDPGVPAGQVLREIGSPRVLYRFGSACAER